MAKLINEKCIACRRDSPLVSEEEVNILLVAIPEWEFLIKNGIKKIERIFWFPDFAAAIAFTQMVGGIAEEEGHHPSLKTEWGKVVVTWWTHKIKGLHRNDFIMAAKTDALYTGSSDHS
ncbi:4a-hydroxytetrahydrobiopterin dehydratase [Dehalococcoidia bacterium]|nr:4a-hydroxytetrahydrobiopterin dehydratase [Dehalococcoidia bacterium]